MVQSLLTLAPEEIPAVVQIFGSDPEIMAEQAAGLIERRGDDVAMIDLNMGCPVAKVVSKGHGSALMRDVALATEITRQVVLACDRPVSVKFRAGWDATSINAVEFAQAMEEAGAAALAIHGRTREQLYDGEADWSIIAEVARAISVPVIGSGDVLSADDAKRMLDETGVTAVMVARGAQGNPWIFREARALIDRGEVLEPPTACERVDMAREHLAATVEFGGEHAFRRMRKHVGWYIQNLPGATRFRSEANHVQDSAEMDDLLVRYRQYLAERDARLSDSEGEAP
jgi:tRNA-dihydrouridine synthase B